MTPPHVLQLHVQQNAAETLIFHSAYTQSCSRVAFDNSLTYAWLMQDTLILASVIAVCTVLILIYWISKH